MRFAERSLVRFAAIVETSRMYRSCATISSHACPGTRALTHSRTHARTPPTSYYSQGRRNLPGRFPRGSYRRDGFKGAAATSGASARVCPDAESRLVGLNPPRRSR
jgi:hypothetical protein